MFSGTTWGFAAATVNGVSQVVLTMPIDVLAMPFNDVINYTATPPDVISTAGVPATAFIGFPWHV